jgi:hypothetical protein
MRRSVFVRGIFLAIWVSFPLCAQQVKPGLLSADDLKRVVPGAYLFRGQSASLQLRNVSGFSVNDGKLVLAGLEIRGRRAG